MVDNPSVYIEVGVAVGIGVALVEFIPLDGGVEAAARSSSAPGAGMETLGGMITDGVGGSGRMAVEASGVGVGVIVVLGARESQPTTSIKTKAPRINGIDGKIFFIPYHRMRPLSWPRQVKSLADRG